MIDLRIKAEILFSDIGTNGLGGHQASFKSSSLSHLMAHDSDYHKHYLISYINLKDNLK